jgi:hypothetical protein
MIIANKTAINIANFEGVRSAIGKIEANGADRRFSAFLLFKTIVFTAGHCITILIICQDYGFIQILKFKIQVLMKRKTASHLECAFNEHCLKKTLDAPIELFHLIAIERLG